MPPPSPELPGGSGKDASRAPEDVARDVALRLLTARPRTRAELATAMAKRGLPDEVVDRVLDRFEELRWVDDAAYAESWVQTRHASRGLSRRALGLELRRRGVDPQTVDSAVAALPAAQEEEAALRLVRQKAASGAHLDHAARVRRLTGLLLRRGYSSGLATRVVLRVLAEEGVLPDSVGLPALEDGVADT